MAQPAPGTGSSRSHGLLPAHYPFDAETESKSDSSDGTSVSRGLSIRDVLYGDYLPKLRNRKRCTAAHRLFYLCRLDTDGQHPRCCRREPYSNPRTGSTSRSRAEE